MTSRLQHSNRNSGFKKCRSERVNFYHKSSATDQRPEDEVGCTAINANIVRVL